MRAPLTAVVSCPGRLDFGCGQEFEGTWLEPADREDAPAPEVQLCPACGHIFEAEYPGYSFRTEAG